ncbi:non-ribosomal peptide synthetase [Streptomyces sp. NPDC051677]|uniref:non-ribosomal peptide synthetase n=1 Tax=Streptomyces sp. NPDC051677 TaxID=3365669 RepID=UPI0037D50E3A
MTGAAAASPACATVLDRFAEQCRTAPGRPAVEYAGRQLTYAELGAAADRVTRRLTAHGVAGSVVALCVDRSFHLPLGVLGILRAGAAYLPLDPGYPPARLDFMLRDSGAGVLLTQRSLAGRLKVPEGARVLLLDEEPADETGSPPATAPGTDDLAYVMYTSGSTGRPKGVAMGHGPLVNLIDWQCAASDCGAGARTLQFSAFSFDASFQEMFSTWAAGGCLVLVDEDVRRDPHRLLGHLDDHGVERLFMPFVALQALANSAVGQGRYPRALREVITAGEQLYVTPALRRFFGALPGARLENQYGPSETHIVTALRLGPDPEQWPDLPAIGRAVDGARIDVVDERGSALPVGERGEIAIAGPVLAHGYLGRPGPTGDRFVPDPLGPPGSRRYLTGDHGRMEPDGLVHFLGRGDGQVKIRGHRVEVGEVEAAVKALPGPADAVVVVNEEPGVGRRLVAYVLTGGSGGSGGPPGDARARLAETLPEYMVPVAVIAVDAFPTTPSGKTDRAALAARPVRISGTGAGGVHDAVEQALTGLWESVLGAEDVGPDDNFFQLGGTSLLAAVLTTRLGEELGVQADLDTFIQQPTPAALAAWIRRQPAPQTRGLRAAPR